MCLKELNADCNIAYVDMQHIRVSYELAKINPLHLTLGFPRSRVPHALQGEAAAAAKALRPVTDGLRSFQLKPAGLHGIALFDHMASFVRRASPSSLPRV